MQHPIMQLSTSFPELKDEILTIFYSYLFKEISNREFDAKLKKICHDHVKKTISEIKKSIKSVEMLNLVNAYFDVARYQTDSIDAAAEWDILDVFAMLSDLIKKRPPPTTPEGRLKLNVPSIIVKKREKL